MAKLRVNEIRDLAKRIIAESSGGIRYSALVQRIAAEHPETPKNTIHGSVWDLDKSFSGEIVKPSRGLFALSSSLNGNGTAPTPAPTPTLREDGFYEKFADWLKSDLDEATEAIALGGSGLRSKWGTPDVVGIFKPLPSNRVKFDLEIISAEIKINASESITAFGQSIAYPAYSRTRFTWFFRPPCRKKNSAVLKRYRYYSASASSNLTWTQRIHSSERWYARSVMPLTCST
jgi:hypothetical protein